MSALTLRLSPIGRRCGLVLRGCLGDLFCGCRAHLVKGQSLHIACATISRGNRGSRSVQSIISEGCLDLVGPGFLALPRDICIFVSTRSRKHTLPTPVGGSWNTGSRRAWSRLFALLISRTNPVHFEYMPPAVAAVAENSPVFAAGVNVPPAVRCCVSRSHLRTQVFPQLLAIFRDQRSTVIQGVRHGSPRYRPRLTHNDLNA